MEVVIHLFNDARIDSDAGLVQGVDNVFLTGRTPLD